MLGLGLRVRCRMNKGRLPAQGTYSRDPECVQQTARLLGVCGVDMYGVLFSGPTLFVAFPSPGTSLSLMLSEAVSMISTIPGRMSLRSPVGVLSLSPKPDSDCQFQAQWIL